MPAAHPFAHSTAGNDPSSYAPYDVPATPTLHAASTLRIHLRRGANRTAGSRLLSASASPAPSVPPLKTVHAPDAPAESQQASLCASRTSLRRSTVLSRDSFAPPSLPSSCPWRRGL